MPGSGCSSGPAVQPPLSVVARLAPAPALPNFAACRSTRTLGLLASQALPQFPVAAGSMDLGFCKGYYMCVNVGYSIGWGYPTETEDSQYFFGTYHGNDLISLPHIVL